MAKKPWLAEQLAGVAAQVRNFAAKIGAYKTELNLTTAQVDAMIANCDAIVLSINQTNACRLTQMSMTQWRDAVLFGDVGKAASQMPVFPVGELVTFSQGAVKKFIADRDMIIALPGYSTAIGQDLGLIGSESAKKPESEIQPKFKSVRSTGDTVTLKGSMQRFRTMIVEYAPKGGEFSRVGVITNMPAVVTIIPSVEGQPESGMLRAYFLSKNEKYGNTSANYTVTVTPTR